MWPFTRKRVASRFSAGPGQPAEVEVIAKVSSPNVVTSPISGQRAAVLRIEVVERLFVGREDGGDYDRFSPLGTTVLGDVLTLVDETGAELSIVARRAHFRSSTQRTAATPLERLPPELAPLLKRATGRGVICYRELPLCQGEEVIVRAFIEAQGAVVARGYRDAPAVRYVARTDLGIIELEEAPITTPF